MKNLIVVCLLAGTLAACGSATSTAVPSEASVRVSASVITPSSPPAPTVTPALSPSAAAVDAAACIIAFPTQYLTDFTPVTISYPGATTSQCAADMKQSDPSAWIKAHPAHRVSSVPAGKPVCSLTVKGITYVVYGASAAAFVCASLPTAS